MSATAWTTTCCRRLAAGMKAVFVRRGPWGWMHAELPDIQKAHIRLETLMDLPDRLAAL